MRNVTALLCLLAAVTSVRADEAPRPLTMLVGYWSYPASAPELREPGWVGIVQERDGVYVRPVRVRTAPAENHHGEEDEVRLETDPKNVELLFRNVRGVEPRRVETFTMSADSFYDDRDIEIRGHGKSYVLRLNARDNSFYDVQVTLTDGRTTQVLFDTEGPSDEPNLGIEFVGDLDGDGKLDLVVNFTGKYSHHEWALWLSSAAGPGQLVGWVTSVETYAC